MLKIYKACFARRIMQFEKDKAGENLGEKAGFFSAYLAFTAVLFLILNYFGKLPAEWGYFHIAGIVFALAAIGIELKDILK